MGFEPSYELEQLVKAYKEQKDFAEKINSRVDEMKKDLVSRIESEGFFDEKGHQWLSAGDYQLKRERRVSVAFNYDLAEVWARANGVWDSVKEVKEVLNEDAFLAVLWDDEDMKDSMDSFYTKRESFAFKVVEGKQYSDD